MKKYISLFIISIIALGSFINVKAEMRDESTPIESFNFVFTEPKIGDEIKDVTTFEVVPEGSVTTAVAGWYLLSDIEEFDAQYDAYYNGEISEAPARPNEATGTFQKDKTYILLPKNIQPADGYGSDENTQLLYNGREGNYNYYGAKLHTIEIIDPSSIYISNLSCTSKYNGELVEEFTASKAGLNIDVDDTYLREPGDYLDCNIEITNGTKEDVTVDQTSINRKSDQNIKYSLTSSGANLVKANGEKKTYNLRVEYLKKYTEDKAVTNRVEIKLENKEIVNPDTKRSILMVLSIIVLVGLLLFIRFDKKETMLLILLTIVMLSGLSVYALNTISITLNSKIYVVGISEYTVSYVAPENVTYSYCGRDHTVSISGTVPIDLTKYKFGDEVEVKDTGGIIIDDTNDSTIYFWKDASNIAGVNSLGRFGPFYSYAELAEVGLMASEENTTFKMPNHNVTLTLDIPSTSIVDCSKK